MPRLNFGWLRFDQLPWGRWPQYRWPQYRWPQYRWPQYRWPQYRWLWGRLRLPGRRLHWIAAGAIAFLLVRWFLTLALALGSPTGGLVVLGGSIQRERFAAQWALAHSQPPLPVLISGGSQPPCLLAIFRAVLPQSNLDRIWIEDCAESTFDNFRFTGPFLRTQGIRKVELVTSGNHSLRAILLGRIMLGAQGIWVISQVLQEVGRPGNQETWGKTLLDTGRGLLWGLLIQVHSPTPCPDIIRLPAQPPWLGPPPKCERFGRLLPKAP